MMTTQSVESLPDFVSAPEAARLAGVNRQRVYAWAAVGLIGIRHLPGCKATYSRSDIENLLAISTRPANRAG